MSDTPLYVSIAANALLALPHVAKAWRRQVETNAETFTRLSNDVSRLTERVTALEEENEALKLAKLDADRARTEAEISAKQAAAAEKRAKAMYYELHDLYTAITATHHGISVPPPKNFGGIDDE